MDSELNAQDLINKRVYHAKGVEKAYERSALNRAETLALLKYQPHFADRDVLDLGVGMGRTTIYLAPLARRYEAIDYSPVMVDAMRRSRPDVSTHLADMRDLQRFASQSFDFILGSNNVLDAVSHQDRLRTLSELRRVLRPDGLLMFSAHNRHYETRLRQPRIQWSRNPLSLGMHLLRWLRQSVNHATIRHLHVEQEEHALYSDEGHDFTCLHYYIDQRAQRQQLAQSGFDLVEVMNHEGRLLGPADVESKSGWLMYIAKASA